MNTKYLYAEFFIWLMNWKTVFFEMMLLFYLFSFRVAVILHQPEHLCSNTGHLMGEYAMKVRHLKLLGYKVIEVSLISLIFISFGINSILELYHNISGIII